jgi:hypothetical protein
MHQFMGIYQFNSNKKPGMPINYDEILKIFAYVKSNLKEKFSFLPDYKFLDMQRETRKAIEKVQIAMDGANQIITSVFMVYDVAVVMPHKSIAGEVLNFLINLSQEKDSNLEITGKLPAFIAFNKNKHLILELDEIADESLPDDKCNFELKDDADDNILTIPNSVDTRSWVDRVSESKEESLSRWI